MEEVSSVKNVAPRGIETHWRCSLPVPTPTYTHHGP